MTEELPETVESHLDAVTEELVDMAVEQGQSLRHMTDTMFTNEVCTPRMEDAPLEDVIKVIDAGPHDLHMMAETYEDRDFDTAMRYFAGLNLQQLLYDRLDVLLGNDDE